MNAAEHEEHVVPVRTYAVILALLMALLVVTVVAAFVDIDAFTQRHRLGSGWNTVLALLIAFTKGLLIVLFFMHVKYGARLTRAFAAAGFVWLGIMVGLTMSDYLTRNHPTGASPRGESKYLKAADETPVIRPETK